MGNIDARTIRKKGFKIGSKEEEIEEYCIKMATTHTDGLLESYDKLENSRGGKYINSDLMKMIFPFYESSLENRRKYNMSITNSAAVLTNEKYKRAILCEGVKRCIYIVGPYGAGKSFFAQSLFENDQGAILDGAIIYEGSITPPAFEEKVKYAVDNGVIPEIIALNPTFELSIRNIKERAKRIGRDVEKQEVISKYADFYENLKKVIEKNPNMPFVIYNKQNNLTLNTDGGSKNLEDLSKLDRQQLSEEYDRIIELLKREESIDDFVV